jgi:pheromone shutdown protein TraB
MIILVGVGHVFQLRQRIERLVEHRRPDLVCIELDEDRYRYIRQKEREGRYPSMTVALLARFQTRTAEMFGTTVGDEMIAAVDAAEELGVPHEFIDMDGFSVMQKLRREMTWREKFWVFIASLGAQFISKKRIEKELREYEENPDAYEEELGRRFPTFKRVLIDERNIYMAGRIAQTTTTHPSVIAVVGDGHVKGITHYLDQWGLPHEIIRLSEIMDEDSLKDPEERPPEKAPENDAGSTVTYSYSFNE